MKALSIRQPWAWAIIHAGKDIENRDWATKYRGPILIHAAKACPFRENLDAQAFIRKISAEPFGMGQADNRGGIIGIADLIDCVSESSSPWFMGKFGFVLANVRRLPFKPCPGKLGIFDIPYEIDAARP